MYETTRAGRGVSGRARNGMGSRYPELVLLLILWRDGCLPVPELSCTLTLDEKIDDQ
jgi:hypothetical protein